MDFTRLTIHHKALFEEWFAKTDSLMSHNDFVTVFAWDVHDTTEFSTEDNALSLRNVLNRTVYYFYPIVKGDGCAISTLKKIREYEGERPFYVTSIPKACVDKLQDLAGYTPPVFDRDNCDYVYNTSDLISLSGKKYHSKRNFVNRFKQRYAYEFRDYTENDFDAVMALYDAWRGSAEDADLERVAIVRVLKNIRVLGAQCGLLFADGILVAMGVVSVSKRNVGVVHFEKALDGYEGAFATINQLCAERYLSGTLLVNREEDLGIDGLRQAKLSYHPTVLLEKFRMGSVRL